MGVETKRVHIMVVLHMCVSVSVSSATAGLAEDKPGEDGESAEGATSDEAGDGDAEGEEDSGLLPVWPKYDGLGYQSGLTLPCSAADVPFPPESAVVAAI
jgi:hypothetical protein